MAKTGKNKRVSQRYKPSSEKAPRSETVDEFMNHPPVWHFKLIDFSHASWGWKALKAEKLQELLQKLQAYESMTWGEIFADKKRNHRVSINQFNKQAVKRLEELKLDENLDHLHRLRLTGTERIWGKLDRYIFNILWWDPNHTVCPSNLKNT